jgi:hypothetical protein
MNCKERVNAALNHQQPDKIPVDFDGTGVTGMHVSNVADLRDYFGLEKLPVKVIEPYQMLGEVDDELAEIIGIDTIPLRSENTTFGFKIENWKEFKTPWDQDVLVPGNFNVTKEANGDLLIYPEGDMSVPPSGRMPLGSYFFDSIIRQEPLDENNLKVEDNQEEFELISEETLTYYANQIPLLKDSGRAVTGGVGGTSFGDISQVPAPFMKHPKGIRDIEEWYVSTVMRRDFIHEIFTKQCDFALQNLEKFKSVVGDILDVIFVCGTDFGTQTSSFCSTDTYEELYAPYYKKVNSWIHENTSWKTFKHSCGAVENFMPHFIDSGFDIINPVQCSATGMDPKLLKDKYGDKIVFWGAGIDTQKTLPFGTPDEVRKEVLERCEVFSPNGGFIFNAIHNVQARTPVENIVAMINAVKEFNGEK